MRDKLIAITPDKWGLLEALGKSNILNMQSLKAIVHDIANTRIEVAEEYYNAAKMLLENNIHDRSVISRAYYSMYHAARTVVYIKMRLDVQEHKKLIKKFKKVLIKEYNDYTLSTLMEDWRMERNLPDNDLCNHAVEDCKSIIEFCKNIIK
ncbi:MAG: HEPN domain-containing protein [Methanosarcinales archaeon]